MPMTTRDSSSGAESSMDFNHHETPTKRSVSGSPSVDEEEEAEDAEVWDQFNRRFREVQSVLDRNRALIQQVNDNHRSRVADNMVKNVGLIQEINGNISKVVSLYSDLSSNFSTFFHHRNDNANAEPTN
ncbi:protein EARLY FLOWERING 4 [Prunus avium]|uniref:Protein EARLY FLOWERING 4 n=1 Tax=Prunus avium TaxID=42229 RepID=A0A6P5RL01_PRUAV|nr:protein EARLY FLOWERING 4 [Prunus avium]